MLAPKTRIGVNARSLREYNLRGFNRYTFSLLAELTLSDTLEFVLFTDSRSPVHPKFADSINLPIVVSRSPRALLWEQGVLPVALRRYNIGLFHAPAEAGVPALASCPSVLTYHRALDKSLEYWISGGELGGRVLDYAPGLKGLSGLYQHYRHALLRWVYLRAAERIIAVSQFGKWELVELLGVPEEKVVVIYEAADEQFSPAIRRDGVTRAKVKYGLPDRYLLFVGGFEPWKNPSGLLRAYSETRKLGVQDRLVLVGAGGDVEGVRETASDLGLLEGKDVFFLERIYEDLPLIYQGATAFVTLSWGESFGLPVVEAMRCGTPVIASNRGAITEVLGSGGVLVDPRKQGEVVEAIMAVTSRPELRSELRERAIKRSEYFSWRKTAEQTLEVYTDVLRHPLGVKVAKPWSG